MVRSSIQISPHLRRRLAKRKAHPRQPYEEVVARALDAADAVELAPFPSHLAPALADVLGGLKRALARLYGERLVRLVLYGSVARGEARPDSDVDVLVVLRGDVDRARELERIVEITYDLLLDRGVHVSALPMAERDFLTRATPLLLNLRREGVPL